MNSDNDWFVDEPGSIPDNCNVSSFPVNEFTFGDTLIANEVFDTTVYGAVFQWEAERYLFKKLRKYPSLHASNSVADQFWSNHQNTNLHRFDSIEWQMEQVFEVDSSTQTLLDWHREYTDSLALQLDSLNLDYASAVTQGAIDTVNTERSGLISTMDLADSLFTQALNTRDSVVRASLTDLQTQLLAILPADSLQAAWRSVLSVWINALANQPDTLTTAEVSTLTEVADRCVFERGTAVIKARMLLKDYTHAEYPLKYGCVANRNAEYSQATPESTETRLTVRPNPANDQVLVEWKHLPEYSDKAQLILTNSFGNDIERFSLSGAEGNRIFQVSHLPQGVYWVRVGAPDGRFEVTQKLLILH